MESVREMPCQTLQDDAMPRLLGNDMHVLLGDAVHPFGERLVQSVWMVLVPIWVRKGSSSKDTAALPRGAIQAVLSDAASNASRQPSSKSSASVSEEPPVAMPSAPGCHLLAKRSVVACVMADPSGSYVW